MLQDEETNCCLHTKLLECLRLSMASVTKSVLVHGILLTESNIGTVLAKVTKKFNKVLFDLYNFSKGILKGWGKLRNVRKEFQRSNVKNYSAHETPYNIMDFERGVWTLTQRTEQNTIVDPLCDGYVHPEWALIFMLRLGLIAIQMLPENTQSNIIVITDAVCGMPDASALQQLLNQLRSYTVSCSFIQLQGRTRSEACFGHVASCELFHFLAMASFGAYIPNCRCSIGVDMDSVQALIPSDVDDEKRFKIMNPFHSASLFHTSMSLFAFINESESTFGINSQFKRRIQEVVTVKQGCLQLQYNKTWIILEADRVLLHIHSFNLDPSFYHIPPGVTTKYPMFHAEDHTHDMKPMLRQKWMHTHLERVVLRSTSLPWNMFESKSGVKINCDWAEDKLHDLLRSNSSFCLVHKQIYVTFVYKSDQNFHNVYYPSARYLFRENSSIPAYFYMIKVTLEPPCLVLKIAFLGGISNADRMKVLDAFRKELINLKIKVDDVDVVYGRTGPVLEQYVLFPPTRALVSVEIDRERLPSLSR
uniref:Protein SZT2 n=1 Tax=Heterorhabditis bacteriophora TaxID=37862 RepID=A0A1I7XAA7_HETBA